jgi:peptidoglycan/LPS O-acetylase OafA/YrhL
MFEVARYILAVVVAATHLSPIGFGWSGWQAVFGFYTLSGYLMTRVLHQRYGFEWSGTAAFLVNRVLRLWPAYLLVVAGTGLIICFYPLNNFFFSLTAPRSFYESVTLVTILGQVSVDFNYLIPLSRLAPTSWSLSIEVFCYCLLGFYFARTPRRLMALAVLGAVGVLLSSGYCWAVPSPYYGLYCFQNRYGVLQAGFIPFAAGGFAYFYRPMLQAWLASGWKWGLAAFASAETLVAVNAFSSVTIGPFLGTIGMLAIITWNGDDKRPSAALDFIGRASYHLFIAHMSIGAILVVVFAMSPNRFPVFVLSLMISLALSGLLVPLEWRLNRTRGRISRWGGGSISALAGAAEIPRTKAELGAVAD